MVAITTTLFPGLRKQLGWGSSDFLRAAGLFWIKKHGESPHFQQGRGFQSDQKQRQTAEGRESEVSSAESTALSTGGPYAARLSSRKVVRFDGPEVIQFLQGLVTNDVTIFNTSFSPPGGSPVPTSNQPSSVSPPIYTAMLTPQGRFLFDMFLYKPNQEGPNRGGSGPSSYDPRRPSLLADVDAESLDEFLGHLKKHRLRAKVDFEDFSSTCSAWARFAGPLQDNDGASEEVESGGMGYGGTGGGASESSEEVYQWCKDPRLGALGQRGLFPLHSTPPLVEAREEVGEEYYKLWRYEHGIPEGSSEIPKGEALPLEYNLDGVNAVSFDKGCYIGQELTARTHFTGVIRKRIMFVEFLCPDGKEEAQKAAIPGSEIVDVSGKRIGKVTAALGTRGLAHLRLETALNETAELRINGDGGAIVKPRRPKWWPSEWTHQARVEVR